MTIKLLNSRTFTDEEQLYILNNYKGKFYNEIVDDLKKEFGKDFTRDQVRYLIRRYGLKLTVSSQFKKGHKVLAVPIGTITRRNNGYYIKISDDKPDKDDNWVTYHRYLWEKEYGEIPEGYSLTFVDGNPYNCNLDNLLMIHDDDVRLRNVIGHYYTGDKELVKAGIYLTGIHRHISTKEKEKQEKHE